MSRRASSVKPHGGTADHELLRPSAPAFTASEPWRVLRIMGEFVEGFEALGRLTRAVSIFGSARIAEGPVYDQVAESDLRLLQVADSPEEVRDLVVRAGKKRATDEAAARSTTRKALQQAP